MKNKKSLGQHWLKDRFILDEIAALSAEGTTQARCLEIGPGLGTLTSALLRVYPEVISVEFDADLARKLPASFPGKNLTVITADFLTFDLSTVPAPNSVAANFPYYITSPIIEKLLLADPKPEKITLLIQKEVADRIAKSGTKNSPLALFCENYATVTLGDLVERSLFTPPPEIDSEIISFVPRATPLVEPEILAFARRAFQMPRKKLTANLVRSEAISREKALEWLQTANLSPNARPEDLSLDDWKTLAILAKKF